MCKIKVKIKKLRDDAVVPSYAMDGDAGMDLTAVSKTWDENGCAVYGTGLAFEIPRGYVGLLFPRSSNCKKDLLLSESVGVLDSGYRGEVVFKFKPTCVLVNPFRLLLDIVLLGRDKVNSCWYNVHRKEYYVGDRVGQIVIIPYPAVEFELSDVLSPTERGDGGFGSSGE